VTALPEIELDLLLNTVTLTVDLAGDGFVGTGFRELHYGEERAAVVGAGEAWGLELVQRWRQAVDRYTAEYGVALLERRR
jgi:hypothetical protein